MASTQLPLRLVLCVDGGVHSGSGQSSIQRIFASVQSGKCLDVGSTQWCNQLPRYFNSTEDTLSTASVLGHSHIKQIQDIYENCCQLTADQDEIWLFGYGRGAYIIRAVAGLLHHCGALLSAGQPEFARDFKKLLRDAESRNGRRSSLTLSPLSSASSAGSRAPPRICFVGAFEPTRPSHGESAFDISLNASVQHMRQAVALHEDRKSTEYLYPEDLYRTKLSDSGRSLRQAWFVGSQGDMGGLSKRAGLSLYPLQWMLLEARRCGLAVTSLPKESLGLVLPRGDEKKYHSAWLCTAANGIEVAMYDFRTIHAVDEYAVRLGSLGARFGSSLPTSKAREPFLPSGMLKGWCDWAPQGTILHPSVFLLLDEYLNVALETRELKLQRNLNSWREKMLGSSHGITNTGFWLDDDADDPDPGAIRVLVCGNTGVGKSTLINKVFGVDVTQSSDRSRGIHDVRQEIRFEGRPDLIVHDSGGFEAGADEEFLAIEAFLKDKSEPTVDVADRLHVIWFCIDINSPRTLQTATEKLFLAVSKYANDVPIVVVATKKDDFLDIEFGTHRKQLKRDGKPFDEEACEQYAEEKLRERVETIRTEMETVEGGRLDACLAVAQDDEPSIAHLSKTTSSCFDTDKVRLLYVRAQVTRIDLKIDLAVCEMIRQYKRLLRDATGATFAPFGSTITRKVSTSRIIKSIINCFGLPTVSADVAVEALRANVWNQTGDNLALAMAEAIQCVGLIGTVFAVGIPAWAITGTFNTSYVVPATCRIFLIMSCDLMLVLARSFKEVTFRSSGQPNEKDVSAAARNYRVRGYSQHVHREIKRLVPRRNMVASFKPEAIRTGIETILGSYKDRLMEDVDLPLKPPHFRFTSSTTLSSDASQDDITDLESSEADSLLFSDLREAQAALAELEARQPVAELDDGRRNVTELPAGDTRPAELEAVESSRI
ncbi:hypothetical protein LTR62_002867 [Meristemomyces frigidus]|uniref:G domain-containing protein n=1 Tax=Meristemomyces frigidus TaxID=1508187 RepID=A0AAN7YJS2_9PEZI|nr:hypothetical protein LTR62_002867 [Meristemomyces frigidus]